MSLTNLISEDLKSAMKEKNAIKLSVLRVLKAELQRSEQSTSGKVELTDGDVIKVVKKLSEGIKETTNDQDELAVLEVYLPKQLSEVEMREIISMLSVKDMGTVMKHFKANYDGQYDGKTLSTLVKESLQ
jgi:uncharacterized protein YqeY